MCVRVRVPARGAVLRARRRVLVAARAGRALLAVVRRAGLLAARLRRRVAAARGAFLCIVPASFDT